MNVKCVTLFDMVVKQGHVVYCVCGVIVVRVGGKKREKPVSKGTCTQKGNVFETTLKRTSVKHQGLFSEASFNTFEIVTSHNFDVLTNNFCRCFTQVFVLSTKQDSAHNFLSSTLGSRFGSGSWPLSLVSDTEPIVGSGLKSTRDRLRDQTDSKSISKRSLRHKGMDNISNLKPVVGPYPS